MLKEKIKQIPTDHWPRGLCQSVALLKLQPSDFGERFGISFREVIDDFDFYKAAILELAPEHKFALVQYRGAKKLGTELWVYKGNKQYTSHLEVFLEKLGLSHENVEWVKPLE